MQKVEKVEGGGWESIVYIVILIATYFQEEAGQIWGCEGQRHSTVWDAKGSHVAQLGVKTPTKMIVINQATDQQISSTVISSPPNPPTPFWGWARGGDARKVTDELFFWPGGSYTWRNLPCQHRVARLHPGDHLFYNSIFSIYPGHSLGQLVHPIQSVRPLTVLHPSKMAFCSEMYDKELSDLFWFTVTNNHNLLPLSLWKILLSPNTLELALQNMEDQNCTSFEKPKKTQTE